MQLQTKINAVCGNIGNTNINIYIVAPNRAFHNILISSPYGTASPKPIKYYGTHQVFNFFDRPKRNARCTPPVSFSLPPTHPQRKKKRVVCGRAIASLNLGLSCAPESALKF